MKKSPMVGGKQAVDFKVCIETCLAIDKPLNKVPNLNPGSSLTSESSDVGP